MMRFLSFVLVCVWLTVLAWGTPPVGAQATIAPALDDSGELPPPPGIAPLRPVLDYLRFYESQPARVLPYLTERFRGGMSPRLWV
ncbi:MAG: hypothetical protein FJZ47_12590, partial [Candidatus Tectomicrobia bacterium]|nr:hypothetical protein [Candidatus Tectomicrobia bacterium]